MSASVIIYDTEPLTFDGDALLTVKYQQTVDILYGSLPEANLEFVVMSRKPLQLQKEQKVELYWDEKLQTVQYVKSCTRLSRYNYRVRCSARLSFLQTECLGGIYTGEDGATQIRQLMEGRELEVDIPLTESSLVGYVPRSTRAEAMQQMLFSMGGIAVFDRSGALRLREPRIGDAVHLLPSRLAADFPTEYLKQYTRFELAAHSYTKGQFQVRLRERAEYPHGYTTMYFSSPYYFYYAESELGAYVEEEGPNYVVVQHPGVFALYAYPYVKETTYHTAQGVASDDPNYSHVMTVRNMTLVNGSNVQKLLARMQEMGSLRQRVTAEYLVMPEEELPQAGDRVSFSAPWGQALEGYVEKSKTEVRGNTLRLTLTILCKEVS